MNVLVRSFDSESKKIVLESDVGEFYAIWEGGAPTIGKVYGVELDWDTELVWKENVFSAPGEEENIKVQDDMVAITVKIENADDDNFVVMRIAESTLMDSIKGIDSRCNMITIMLESVTAYDMNL